MRFARFGCLVPSFIVATLASVAHAQAPANVILFIGDGMGFEQVKGASMYGYGAAGMLNFEKFPYQSMVSTYNASGTVTDSAASGTAIATGYKAANGVISIANPGDGSNRLTLLEHFKSLGKSTGLVTTDLMTGATPATFGAHEPSRNNTANIADDYVNVTTGSRPNALLGGGAISGAVGAGYTVVADRTTMNGASVGATGLLSGQFSTSQFGYVYDNPSFYNTYPYLSEMTSKAINQLSGNSNGFFLMVEQALIDKAGTNTGRNLSEVLELEKAVQQAVNFAQSRTDTLVIVTADHETGGLKVTQNNGQGNLPSVAWTSGNHSTAPVPVYAFGPNAQMISRTLDNTDLFKIATATSITPTTTKRFQEGADGYAGAHDTFVRLTQPTTPFGAEPRISVDLDEDGSTGGNQTAQALLRFDDLFGPGSGQIPNGAIITAAKLLVMTGATSGDGTVTSVSAHRMLQSWDENVTWDLLGNGLSAGQEAALNADNSIAPSANNTGVYAVFDVTASVQAWTDGAPNHGWALLPNGTDGWWWNSVESATQALRPVLEVTYVVPEPSSPALLGVGALVIMSLTWRRRR